MSNLEEIEEYEPEETSLVQGAWSRFPWWFFDRGVKCHGISGLFFPGGDPGEVARAKAVCNGKVFPGDKPCPFRKECLEWAMDNNEKWGVWGGTSERDRRKLRKARGLTRTDITSRRIFKVRRRFTIPRNKGHEVGKEGKNNRHGG